MIYIVTAIGILFGIWVYCYDSETKLQYLQQVLLSQELFTKVMKGRYVWKKMIALFFRWTGHCTMIVLENKRQLLQSDVCVPDEFKSSKLAERSPNTSAHLAIRTTTWKYCPIHHTADITSHHVTYTFIFINSILYYMHLIVSYCLLLSSWFGFWVKIKNFIRSGSLS